MNGRQRWVKWMHFEKVDYPPDEEFGYWGETLRRWQEEGLPSYVKDNQTANEYFGFSPRSNIPVNLSLVPPFEMEVLEETSEYRIIIDRDGVKKKELKDGSSIPHFLGFPLKGRKEWEEIFKPRLDPGDASRYPHNHPHWEQMKACYNSPQWDKPVGINIGSLFGWLRDWAGFEGISLLCYDDPKLVEEMVEHLSTLTCTVIERAVKEVSIDYGAGWEDMCFNHGPIISPDMVRRFLVPNYKKITQLLRTNGCDIVYTDCDGNINPMIDLWLEGGLNGIFPVEVAAGSDPVAIRRKYGDKIVILGGVNKRALIAGKDTILKEVQRIAPYVKEGGWIPHVDHRCPPDVSFENYIYYLEVKRTTLGIPHPQEFESRPEIRKIKSRWKGKFFRSGIKLTSHE